MLYDSINRPTGVVKIVNSRGPRTDPCGTPVVQFVVDEQEPPTET